MREYVAGAAAPEAVTIGERGRVLTLQQGGGEPGRSFRLEAALLRRACRCAGCTRARRGGAAIAAAVEISIVAATPVGGYGLNLAFSDGHERGIFPFSYLADLAQSEQPA